MGRARGPATATAAAAAAAAAAGATDELAGTMMHLGIIVGYKGCAGAFVGGDS